MARRKNSEIKSVAEQQEVLDKPVNQSGAGEDPAVQALLSEDFTTMNDKDALAVAIAVAKVVRGQLQEELDGTMGKLTETLMKMEETAKRWEKDRMKFAEEMYDLAEKTKSNTNNEMVVAAKGAELMKRANEEAAATAAARKMAINKKAAEAPKIRMVHPGVPMQVRIGDSIVTKVKPFEINFEHLRYVLPPNTPVEIPNFVYDHYMQELERAKDRDKLKTVLAGATKDYGKAIQVEPAVDPNYATRISETLNNAGIVLPGGGN